MTAEILDPAFTRTEVRDAERKALTLFIRGQQATMQFAAMLSEIQDRCGHMARGYKDFGKYCEDTFEGLGTNNARQLARSGKVLRVLENRSRLNLATVQNSVASTAVRDLATLYGKYGEDRLVEIWDRAAEGEGKITPEKLNAAVALLIEPSQKKLEIEPPEPTAEDEADESDGYDEGTADLLDQILDLHQQLDDLSDDLTTGRKPKKEVEKIIENLNIHSTNS